VQHPIHKSFFRQFVLGTLSCIRRGGHKFFHNYFIFSNLSLD